MNDMKKELVNYIIRNLYDEKNGIIDLTELDFGEYSVDTSCMKVGGSLFQCWQNVSESLFQGHQKVGGYLYQGHQNVSENLHQNDQTVGGSLFQDSQKVDNDLYQNNQKVGGEIKQDEIKTMKKQDIENELGYKIIIEEE